MDLSLWWIDVTGATRVKPIYQGCQIILLKKYNTFFWPDTFFSTKTYFFFELYFFFTFFSYFIIFLGFFFLILKTSLFKSWKIFARLRRELFIFNSLRELKQFEYIWPCFASPLMLQNLLKEPVQWRMPKFDPYLAHNQPIWLRVVAFPHSVCPVTFEIYMFVHIILVWSLCSRVLK